MSLRTIAKFCFLLVIIGFFMPMACDMNGFQLADGGMLDSLGIFAIYASFAGAIAGFLIGVLLLLNKRVPVYIDWLIVLFCFLCIIITFYNVGYNQGYSDYFQSGVYVVLTGSILALVFQIGSAVKKEGKNIMFCTNCGKKIDENQKYCTGCGAGIGGGPTS